MLSRLRLLITAREYPPFARSTSRSEIDEIDEIDELSENGFRDKTEHGGNTKPLLKSCPDANPRLKLWLNIGIRKSAIL
jgi:hypothetical protein